MRSSLLLGLILIASLCQSQITITTNHLPDADDTLVTRNATLLEDVDLESTGANHVWNFDFDILQPLNLNPDVICYDVNETPFVYQYLFNNPFDPAHNSDFGIGVQQAGIAAISFENAYMYYQNSNTKYAITGMGASINGLPLAAHMNEPDLLYNLPLVFNSLDTSHTNMEFDVPQLGYYGLEQERSYHCDGWGTLNIWEQSFQVLRVRSVVNAADSIFTSFVNLGIRLPRPETITYEWLSTTHIEPILKITTTAGVVTQVQTADIYEAPSSVGEVNLQSMIAYPNPANDELHILGILSSNAKATIYDGHGRKVLSETIGKDNTIHIAELGEGFYCVMIESDQRVNRLRFIKE